MQKKKKCKAGSPWYDDRRWCGGSRDGASEFSDAWSEKAVLETLRQPTALCLVAEKAGRRVGYLLAYQAADEIEIARVAVVEEVKRQG